MTQREIAAMLDRLSRRMRHKYAARKFREDAGLTLHQLGELIGATGSSVCRWETGLKFPAVRPGSAGRGRCGTGNAGRCWPR